MRRLADGRVCFNWYRIDVTIPERVGDLDPTGATVVFEVVVDDYAEVWVNGEMPLALGRPAARWSPASTRPTASCSPATPGRASGSSSPCSASTGRSRPRRRNYIWMRTATLDFYPARAGRDDAELERVAGGFEFTEGPVWSPDGALLFSSPNTNAIYRLDPEPAA